jgi:hypothetical protein
VLIYSDAHAGRFISRQTFTLQSKVRISPENTLLPSAGCEFCRSNAGWKVKWLSGKWDKVKGSVLKSCNGVQSMLCFRVVSCRVIIIFYFFSCRVVPC